MRAFTLIDTLSSIRDAKLRGEIEEIFTSKFGCVGQLEYAVWFATERGFRPGINVECPKCGRVALIGDDGVQCTGDHAEKAASPVS